MSCIQTFPQTTPKNQPISDSVGILKMTKVQEKDRPGILLDPPCCTVVPQTHTINTNILPWTGTLIIECWPLLGSSHDDSLTTALTVYSLTKVRHGSMALNSQPGGTQKNPPGLFPDCRDIWSRNTNDALSLFRIVNHTVLNHTAPN